MKLYNTKEDIYENALGVSPDGETSACMVCKKEFTSKKRAENHVKKQKCYTFKDLFQNTVFEKRMYSLYKEFLSIMNNNSNVTMSTFRNSGMYNTIARLFKFCIDNKVSDISLYSSFCLSFNNNTSPKVALEMGHSANVLNNYRKFLRLNPEYINSGDFIEQNKKQLSEDLSFIIRSIERADVDISTLIENIDIMDCINQSNEMQRLAFENLLDQLETEKMESKLL